MSKVMTLVAVVAAAAAVTGCQTFARSAGMTKTTPDEFRVVTSAPLTLPPDYSLRPPRPGDPRPQEMAPDQEAHAALFGTDVAQNASPGERSLVSAAGADAIDPSVRDQVDFESQNIVHRSDAFVDSILNFNHSNDPSAAPMNGETEQQRLAREEQIRRATGGGQVIIQRDAPGGFKLPGT